MGITRQFLVALMSNSQDEKKSHRAQEEEAHDIILLNYSQYSYPYTHWLVYHPPPIRETYFSLDSD